MVEQNLPLVLITGVSGYIGSAVCYDFLKDKQYRVRGTVRDMNNKAKIQPIKDAFGKDFERLELVNADLLDEVSIDKAIAGAHFVIHTASPCDMGGNNLKNEDEVRLPAVNGTMAVMKACHKHKVKRMVITSSVGAISLGYKPEDHPKAWTDKHWSQVQNMNGPQYWYLKSKVLAESTAWDYIKTMPENERFELVSINPGLVLGPAFVGAGFTSGEFVTGIMEGTKKYLPPNNVVDVRDVAKAHLMAVKKDAAVGRRFVLVNQLQQYDDMAVPLHKEFNGKGWTFNKESSRKFRPKTPFDHSPSAEILEIDYKKDMGYTYVDMAHSMLKTGALVDRRAKL